MASHRGDRTKNPTSNAGDVSKIDLLLHPELLSQEFIQLMLHEVRLGATRNQSGYCRPHRITCLFLMTIIIIIVWLFLFRASFLYSIHLSDSKYTCNLKNEYINSRWIATNESCLRCVLEEDSSGWPWGPRPADRSVSATCASSPAERSAQQPLGEEDTEEQTAQVLYSLTHSHRLWMMLSRLSRY